jgi:hypothetical protein
LQSHNFSDQENLDKIQSLITIEFYYFFKT